MVFQPILESSKLSLSLSLSLSLYAPSFPGSEVNDAEVGSWRGCFVMSWGSHVR
jgi:hypothetical protein